MVSVQFLNNKSRLFRFSQGSSPGGSQGGPPGGISWGDPLGLGGPPGLGGSLVGSPGGIPRGILWRNPPVGSPPGTWEDPPGNHLGKTSQRGSLVLGLVYVQQGSGGNPFERGYAGLEKAASTRAASSSWTRGSALDSRQRHGSTQTVPCVCVCVPSRFYEILRDPTRPLPDPLTLGAKNQKNR